MDLLDLIDRTRNAPLCRFCGGLDGPDHAPRCDGRQGHVEAALPALVSGLEPATHATSEAAAVSVETTRDTQRALVFAAIRQAGARGLTDDEIQAALGLDGSSERPRRWELWKLQRIAIAKDADGVAVKRITRTHRRAVVWVAA
jgi:hypothetical protein